MWSIVEVASTTCNIAYATYLQLRFDVVICEEDGEQEEREEEQEDVKFSLM